MWKLVKQWWNGKIQITVNYKIEGVSRIEHPQTVLVDAPNIRRRHQSNYRFVKVHKLDHDGKDNVYWHTEEYENGRWGYSNDTLSSNKDEAMKLHLKVIEKGSLRPTETKTIEWEGLDKEETATWVLLQTENKDE